MTRGVVFVALLSVLLGCDDALDAALMRQWDWADHSLLTDGKLHVVLVGTGLPIPDSERLPACTAIVVDGELILVDAGPGTIRQADLLGLPIRELSAILTTHFHSDHIGGLGDALAHSWFRGRQRAVEVYGPPGVAAVVHGFSEAYRFDTEARALPLADELDPKWRTPIVHEVALQEDGTAPVFRHGDLEVSAFLGDHSPIAPAYGYRIDYRGLSVVLTGDTRNNPRLSTFARDADLLIHSAAGVPGFLQERLLTLQEAENLPRVDPELFATPLQAAAVAERARARKLVFSHILPINNFLFRWYWLRGVSSLYDGEVVVGEDGMRFDLTPTSP